MSDEYFVDLGNRLGHTMTRLNTMTACTLCKACTCCQSGRIRQRCSKRYKARLKAQEKRRRDQSGGMEGV